MKNRITLLTGGLLFCTVLLFSCANGSSDDLLAKIETTENKATETTSDESKAKEINPIAKTLFGNSYVISKVISTYNSNFKHYAEFDKKEEIVSNGIKTVTFYKNGTKTKTETEQFETVEHIFYKDFTGRFNGKNITWEVNSDNTVKCSATQDGQSYSINISSTDNFETWSVTIENSDGTMVCYVKKYSTGNEKPGIINNPTNLITTFQKGTTIWTGTIDMGKWEANFNMEPKQFGYFSAGDQIQITHTKSDTYSDETYLILSPMWLDWDNNRLHEGTGINCKPTSLGLNPYSQNQTTAYTLTESDVAKIKTDGLVIWGCGLKITKIVYSCKVTQKLNLAGYKYKTNYTVSMEDSINNIHLTNEPLFIEMGWYDYNSNSVLMGFRVKNDLIIDGTKESWLGVSGFLDFSPDERTGTITIYERENNIHILKSASQKSYTVPEEFSVDQEFSVSYTSDFRTLTLKNKASGNEYNFTVCKNWTWME